MVGIKGKGDVHQKWEDKIPPFKMIDKKEYELYATFTNKEDAEETEDTLKKAGRTFGYTTTVKIIPITISEGGRFTMYCLYVRRMYGKSR